MFEIHPEITKEQAQEDRRMLTLWLLKTALKAAVAGCVIAMIFFAGKASAAPLIHATPLQELFLTAVKLGGYEKKCLARMGGCEMPSVLIASIDDDNTVGQFDPRQPVLVKINTRIIPGSLGFNAVLVHEFTHYLQWLFGELGPQTQCQDQPKIEEQAYKAAAAYLAQFGIVYDYSDAMFGVLLMAAMCSTGGM